jgi:superfamily II DNA or RNA helicase
MELRDYQSRCVTRTLNAFRQYRKLLDVIATGGGKTIVFSEIARRLAEAKDRMRRTLVIAHRTELIDQAAKKMFDHCGIVAGIEKGQSRPSIRDRFVVASVQTLVNSYTRYPRDWFDLVVVDECHHILTKSYQAPLTHFEQHARILGVTATPHPKLGKYFDFLAFEKGLVELISDKWLVPITVQTFKLDLDLESVAPKSGDFSDNKVGNALEPWLEGIAARMRSLIGMRKTLVFLPIRKTSMEFVRLLRAVGITANHVDGESADRAEILTGHGTKFQVLCNAMLLTEGYDDPSIECVLILRPTKSEIFYSQAVGRGTRLFCPNGCRQFCGCAGAKKNLLLLDPLWLHETNSLVRPANLVTDNEEEQETIRGRQMQGEITDLLEDAKSAAKKREEALAMALEKKKRRREEVFDLSVYAKILGSQDVLSFEPTADWHSASITPKQIELLKKFHINPAQVKNRGHANQVICKYFDHKKSHSPSNKPMEVSV